MRLMPIVLLLIPFGLGCRDDAEKTPVADEVADEAAHSRVDHAGAHALRQPRRKL